jgi:hypothetical protein
VEPEGHGEAAGEEPGRRDQPTQEPPTLMPAGLSWRKASQDQWVADQGGYYVITYVEDRRDIFVGEVKMSTQVRRYYELEANGHVLEQEFWHFEHAASAAKTIEEKRT